MFEQSSTCAARWSLKSSTVGCPCDHGRSLLKAPVQSNPGRNHPFEPVSVHKSNIYCSCTSPSWVRCQGRALSQSLCISGVCLLRRRIDATRQLSAPSCASCVFRPFCLILGLINHQLSREEGSVWSEQLRINSVQKPREAPAGYIQEIYIHEIHIIHWETYKMYSPLFCCKTLKCVTFCPKKLKNVTLIAKC